VGSGRPTQPISGTIRHPLDLDDPRTIYSPHAKSHTSIHSPLAAEEQRREGHYSREERVELVV
jgi:hypothetical protein